MVERKENQSCEKLFRKTDYISYTSEKKKRQILRNNSKIFMKKSKGINTNFDLEEFNNGDLSISFNLNNSYNI